MITQSQFYELVAVVEGCGVKFQDAWLNEFEQEGGSFLPFAVGGPTIRIERHRSELHGFSEPVWSPTTAQVQDAFFTLAHEFGHFLSWRADKAKWNLVHAAHVRRRALMYAEQPVLDGLPIDERRIILDEEERAWELGREYVPEDCHPAYDLKAQERLDGYRQELPLT